MAAASAPASAAKASLKTYEYKAARMDGKIETDTIQAESKEDVVAAIREKNLVPCVIREKTIFDSDLKDLAAFKPKVTTKDLAIFCRQLSVMLASGMPISRALDIQAEQTKNPTLKESTVEVSAAIKRGEPLSRSMREFPGSYPEILTSMVEAGEATGNLDGTLAKLSAQFTSDSKIQAQIINAMIYPIILLVVMVVVIIVIMIFVLPQFKTMLESSGSELPKLTQVVMGISDNVMQFWYLYLIGAIAIGTWFTWYKNSPTGKYRIDEFKINFGPIKEPMSQIVTARFTRTLASLISSGISIVEGLIMAAKTSGNLLVIDAITLAGDGIKRGMSLASELRKIEYFPPMMVSMVSIGEETGELDALLSTVADFYEEELETGIKRLVQVLDTLILLLLAGVVVVILLAIFIPMLEMNTALSEMGS